MADNDFVKSKLVEILLGPHIRQIDFKIGPLRVDTLGFYNVFNALASGLIDAVVDYANMKVGNEAEYRWSENSFFFSRSDYGKISEEQSIMAHECCHAIVDIRKLSM
jgi:hypothetical protein